jgi:molecular chaperone DnaK
VKDAEAHGEEDRKRKEEAEIKNAADSMVYTAEKTLRESGDKIDESSKGRILAEIEKARDALKGTDTQAIKQATDDLTKTIYQVTSELYAKTSEQAKQETPGGETDYEVVDEK